MGKGDREGDEDNFLNHVFAVWLLCTSMRCAFCIDSPPIHIWFQHPMNNLDSAMHRAATRDEEKGKALAF